MGAAATVNKSNTNDSKKSNDMSCEICLMSINIFTRKKCVMCVKFHCSKCLMSCSVPSSRMMQKICLKCQKLASGNFTRQDLSVYSIKELRQFLVRRSISVNNCTEKTDLVELVLQTCSRLNYRDDSDHVRHVEQLKERMKHENRNVQSSPAASQRQTEPSSSSSSAAPSPSASIHQRSPDDASTNDAALRAFPRDEPVVASNAESERTEEPTGQEELPNTGEVPATQSQEQIDEVGDTEQVQSSGNKRTLLDDIKQPSDIDGLTVRQLKELLVTNYVDYKGCCEKKELLERVQRLWQEHSKNKETADDINGVASDDLCKVCMDAVIDCILLECGHMITCTKCGKRMAECPVCRHYVSRVVHVFRS